MTGSLSLSDRDLGSGRARGRPARPGPGPSAGWSGAVLESLRVRISLLPGHAVTCHLTFPQARA